MITDPSIYTDFNGLAAMRREAREDSGEALEKVARQFESLFLQMMLKNMRDAELGDDLFGSDQTKLYQDMHDKQLATSLSDGGSGIGLADMLVRQLRGSLPSAKAEAESEVRKLDEGGGPLPPRQAFAFRRTEPVSGVGEAAQPVFDSPESFVKGLWPQARRAAEKLGVAPEALIAQAALETGWGKAVIRRPDGSSSHNLFNIKADHRWDGEQVIKKTLEYRDGLPQQEVAPFRAYGSYRESFEDYVRFLSDSPRYRPALEKAGDPAAFVEALQEAGYATDPAYARKIQRILGSDVLAGLKSSGKQTLTG